MAVGFAIRGCKRAFPAVLLFAWSLAGSRLLLPGSHAQPLRHAAVGTYISTAEPIDDQLLHRRSLCGVLPMARGTRVAAALHTASSGVRAPAPAAPWPIVRRRKIPPSSDSDVLPS